MLLERCIKPGYLSQVFRADERRMEFDCKNQTVVQKEYPVDIIFVGDSITQMWELPVYFGEISARVLNRGIGGDRTGSLLHRFRADVVQLKPKIVVVMIGINDTWDLEFDYWKQEKGRKLENVLREATENMDKVLHIASEEEFQTIVCSILPTCMEWTNHEIERKVYVKEFNLALKKLVEKYKMIFVDFSSVFLEEDGYTMRKELSLEGLHPNVFGYDKMADALKKNVDFSKLLSEE